MQGGKLYFGVCEGCIKIEDALATFAYMHAKALEIKIQTIRNGQILEESPPIIIDAK